MLRLALALAVLATLVPPAIAEEGPDLVIHLEQGEAPRHEGAPGLATLAEEEAGERLAWNLTLSKEFTVVEVRARGYFDVERARQVLPLLDGRYFAEFPLPDLSQATEAVPLFNLTGDASDLVLRLGFPGPGSVNFTLERDVEPPVFAIGGVDHITHYSFVATTTTLEPALADLRIRPAAGGDELRNPTVRPALEQTFPVQGLDPATAYAWHVVFKDWSGNVARSDEQRLLTAPEPVRPLPRVLDLVPAANATVPPPVLVVSARVVSDESPVTFDGVRLFVDKREVVDEFTFEDGVVTYRLPEPLRAGFHSVSLEVTNVAGGRAIERWTFTVDVAGVAGETSTPGAAAVGAMAALALVALLRRRA